MSTAHIVAVCGSRHWANRPILDAALDRVLDELPRGDTLVLLEGGQRGADEMARDWAKRKDVAVETFKADWDTYGVAAGPIRNGEILKRDPERLLVFHENFAASKGSRDMVLKAKAKGIRIAWWNDSSVRPVRSYIPTRGV